MGKIIIEAKELQEMIVDARRVLTGKQIDSIHGTRCSGTRTNDVFEIDKSLFMKNEDYYERNNEIYYTWSGYLYITRLLTGSRSTWLKKRVMQYYLGMDH